jgi:hypothetical protein
VPRFYFHVLDDLDTDDPEGAELPDIDAARGRAVTAARVLMCETLTREGRITLHHRIDIEDDQGQRVDSVLFRDVVRIENDV